MNHKFIPAIAAFLIIGMLLSAVPLSYAQTVSFGPQLGVVTIPQDNQKLATGVMILGINPINPGLPTVALPVLPMDLMSQHKLSITYNGQPLYWQIGTAGPSVFCTVYEKDKVNVIPDPKTGKGDQGTWENLMTVLKDVSTRFVCKARWKSPAPGVYESTGVLDVYYVGPLPHAAVASANPALANPGVTNLSVGYFIADNILSVTASVAAGKTVIWGSDIQDICVLGWAVTPPPVAPWPGGIAPMPWAAYPPDFTITKPDGTQHYIWANAMGNYLSCEGLALAQRAALGIALPTGQDPLAP